MMGPALFVAVRDYLDIDDGHGAVSAVARAIDVQRMTVQRWRDGTREPRPEHIERIVERLQVGVDLRCVAGTARWAVVLR
jgi:transposase-like protein